MLAEATALKVSTPLSSASVSQSLKVYLYKKSTLRSTPWKAQPPPPPPPPPFTLLIDPDYNNTRFVLFTQEYVHDSTDL